jgi:hypothetical protein
MLTRHIEWRTSMDAWESRFTEMGAKRAYYTLELFQVCRMKICLPDPSVGEVGLMIYALNAVPILHGKRGVHRA